MIISDYALLEYKHIKEIGGIQKVEKRRVWLKHIKKIKIKDNCLMVYAMKEDCMDLTVNGVGHYKGFGEKTKECDIFEYFRIRLNDIIKLEL